jgi:hypothetical protein
MPSSGGLYYSMWEFHRDGGTAEELVLSNDNTGTIVSSSLNGVTINGTFEGLNISFNDAQFPGEVIRVSFYTGMVDPVDNWAPDYTFMAGTYQETEVTVTGGVGGRPTPPINAPLADAATSPAATATMAPAVDAPGPAFGDGPPSVQVTVQRGPWYAILKFLDT